MKKAKMASVLCVVVIMLSAWSVAEAVQTLEYVGSILEGVDGVYGLVEVRDVIVSWDGKHAYSAAINSDAVSVFDRDVNTGLLSQKQVLQDGVGGLSGLDGANSACLSPDGKYLYAAGRYDDTISVFSRDLSTGLLTFSSSVADGAAGVDGLDGVKRVEGLSLEGAIKQ